jgi:N utilization substance protein B
MDRSDERSDARERALHLLYEAHSKAIAPADTLALQAVRPDPLAAELVVGVGERQEEIDGLIAATAKGWTLARMPVLDLNIMRLAVYELLARPEVPVAVVLNEAVELAKRFSTDDSGRFVNGVLAAIARRVRPSASEPPDGARRGSRSVREPEDVQAAAQHGVGDAGVDPDAVVEAVEDEPGERDLGPPAVG